MRTLDELRSIKSDLDHASRHSDQLPPSADPHFDISRKAAITAQAIRIIELGETDLLQRANRFVSIILRRH